MKRFLFMYTSFGGHVLEYFIHIYHYAIDDEKNTYYFIFSPDFKKHIECEQLVLKKNIILRYLTVRELERLHHTKKILKSYWGNRLLNEKIRKYDITDVIMCSYDCLDPLFAFMTMKKVSYIGIYYYIYLYEWADLSIKQRILKSIIFWKMAHNKSIKKICICNDSSSAAFFNRKYQTMKFDRISDPYVSITLTLPDFRKDNAVKEDAIVLSHIGVLSERKGTLNILKAIKEMSVVDRNQFVFVFAGKTDLDIKDEFYRLAAECSEKYRLIIKDYFCSYEEISAICKSSNVLLIPYLNNSQSSGVLGYAAQFNVPVFSPSSNMLGKIVRKSKLGYISSDVEILGIKTFLESCLLNKLMTIDDQEYLKLNTVNSFLNTLLN